MNCDEGALFREELNNAVKSGNITACCELVTKLRAQNSHLLCNVETCKTFVSVVVSVFGLSLDQAMSSWSCAVLAGVMHSNDANIVQVLQEEMGITKSDVHNHLRREYTVALEAVRNDQTPGQEQLEKMLQATK